MSFKVFCRFLHSDLRHVLIRLIFNLPEDALKVSDEHTPVCAWHVQIGNAEKPQPQPRGAAGPFAVPLQRTSAAACLSPYVCADCSLTFIFGEDSFCQNLPVNLLLRN